MGAFRSAERRFIKMKKRVAILLSLFFLFAGIIFIDKTVFASGEEWYIELEDYELEYNGKVQKPDVSVYVSKNLYEQIFNMPVDESSVFNDSYVLLNSTDYSVIYHGNFKKVGKYSLEITLKNGEHKKKSFKIIPKETAIKKLASDEKTVSVKWTPIKKQVDGYQLKYGRGKSLKKAKTIIVKNKNIKSNTVTNLDSNSIYYFQIRTYKTVSGKKYYSDWSDTYKVKTKKGKYDVDYNSAEELEDALNDGKNCNGKTAKIKVTKFVPDSAFGYNIWAGEHLNFISSNHPKAGKGDTITVKIKEVNSFLGSWIITYERIK